MTGWIHSSTSLPQRNALRYSHAGGRIGREFMEISPLRIRRYGEGGGRFHVVVRRSQALAFRQTVETSWTYRIAAPGPLMPRLVTIAGCAGGIGAA